MDSGGIESDRDIEGLAHRDNEGLTHRDNKTTQKLVFIFASLYLCGLAAATQPSAQALNDG